MKRKFLLALILAPFFNVTVATANPNTVMANICTIIQSDDKTQLRKKLRTLRSDYRLKLVDFYDAVSCSGLTMIRHSIKSGSVETGTYLIKKMSKKSLETPKKDSKTELDWAIESGFTASPIVAELKDRIS